jgi:hypothetical protein
MIKHTVSRKTFSDGQLHNSLNYFVYRGITFARNDSQRGYWDHYKTVSSKYNIRAETRKCLLVQIDEMLDKPT